MHKQRLVIAGATLLAATMAMSGCGSRAEQAPGGSASSGGGSAKVAKIGLIAPLRAPVAVTEPLLSEMPRAS